VPGGKLEFIKNLFDPTDFFLNVICYYKEIFHKAKNKESRKYALLSLFSNFTYLGLSVLISIAFQSLKPITFYFISLVFIYKPIHHLLEFPEHAFCNTKNKSILENTRSITGGFISTWFTNFNNLHAEHHKYPKVKFFNLIDIHNQNRKKLLFKSDTYIDFYVEFWGLLNNEVLKK
jgi:fatty acid desaturase